MSCVQGRRADDGAHRPLGDSDRSNGKVCTGGSNTAIYFMESRKCDEHRARDNSIRDTAPWPSIPPKSVERYATEAIS